MPVIASHASSTIDDAVLFGVALMKRKKVKATVSRKITMM
jgi:hypothetical protein